MSTPGKVTYSEYLKVPTLLDQQQCLTPGTHDELQFIIVHQVYELWFKLVLHEIDEIQRLVDDGSAVSLRGAVRLARRVHEIFRVLVLQIHVLETMRPTDFLKFRSALNPASGFGSVQFRETEVALGLKDRELASHAAGDPRYPQLLARLDAPSLVDSFYARLQALGLDVTPPSPERTPEQERETIAAIKTIYDNPDDHATVYELCEALVDVDEQLILWRRHHVMMVERHIGLKPGTGKDITGGTDGIRYLAKTFARRAFDDLWAVRSVLTD